MKVFSMFFLIYTAIIGYKSQVYEKLINIVKIEVTTGQKYNLNGVFVWYFNAGNEVVWEERQTTLREFTNVNLMLGGGAGDTTGGYIRNLKITDLTPDSRKSETDETAL